MLHTMFEVQSIHLQAALWMGMSLSQIKKIPSFWEWPPPSPRNNWSPRCVLFPLLLCVGKVFFFFLPLSGSSFFFLQKLPAPPPWSLMVRPLVLNGWQLAKWKRVFLTFPCHEIYRDVAVGLKSCKNTWKITIFVKMWNLGQFRENLIFCQ